MGIAKNSFTQDTPIKNILALLSHEKRNVKFLYVYAVFSGVISLAIPLGIQTIIGFVMAGRLSTSWFLLSVVITLCVLLAGITKLAQLSIIDSVERKLFLRFGEVFRDKISELRQTGIKYGWYVKMKTSYFMDVITLQKSLSKLLTDFTGKLLQAIFGLLLLSLYHPVFIVFGIAVLIIVFIVLRLTWKRGFETARRESNFKFLTAESLRRLFAEDDTEMNIEEINGHLNNYAESRTQHFGILYRQAWLGILTKVLFTAMMLILGSYLLVNQSISLGQFLAAEILIITLLDAIEKLILTVENLYDCGIAIEKLNQIMEIDG